MKRILIGLAALAAFVSFSGVALVARAEMPVRCEVTKEGKKTTQNAANADACQRMGGTVVTAEQEKEKAKEQAKDVKEKAKEPMKKAY